ncbi:MAG: fibronectin type III domain-containing protein [Clostridia bacterium]|nr:fibronectin type III domain-containing protein [Clostridia bacterium]
MKKVFRNLLTLMLVILTAFSVVTVASAASIGKVTSLQAYNIDDDEINLKWKKVSGADGYQVYMYKNKAWKSIGTTKKTSFEADDLVSAKQYKFKVRAYELNSGKKTYGAYSSVLKSATKPDQVENVRLSSKTKTSVTLKWAKEKRATGYQVYMYNAETGKFVRKATVTGLTATVRGLKAGTSYRFKVRAYFKVDSKNYYGEFSDVISVKTKGTTASVSKASTSVIGNTKAGNIALKNAGLKKSQVRDFECKLDTENGIRIYEVEFEYGQYDYEYDINATTGKIISVEKSRD